MMVVGVDSFDFGLEPGSFLSSDSVCIGRCLFRKLETSRPHNAEKKKVKKNTKTPYKMPGPDLMLLLLLESKKVKKSKTPRKC